MRGIRKVAGSTVAAPAAALICSGYATAHVHWAIAGSPAFLARGESVVTVSVWVPAVPAALAVAASAVVCAGGKARPTSARWLVGGVAFLAGGTLIVYCVLFWISLYFGVGGISAMPTGKQVVDVVSVLDTGGYIGWGIGLLIASASYYCLTKPPCPDAVPI